MTAALLAWWHRHIVADAETSARLSQVDDELNEIERRRGPRLQELRDLTPDWWGRAHPNTIRDGGKL